MNALKSSREKESTHAAEPYHFTKRLGSTTFLVTVHWGGRSNETAKNKIARLIRNDAMLGKVVNL